MQPMGTVREPATPQITTAAEARIEFLPASSGG